MDNPFEAISSLDRLVHEPARLAILAALNACRDCDFVFLQSLTGLTKGNLSSHLQKLQDAGLLQIRRRLRGGRMRTMAALTDEGRLALERHWRSLEALRNAAYLFTPTPSVASD